VLAVQVFHLPLQELRSLVVVVVAVLLVLLVLVLAAQVVAVLAQLATPLLATEWRTRVAAVVVVATMEAQVPMVVQAVKVLSSSDRLLATHSQRL
jgi:hypothetical protein